MIARGNGDRRGRRGDRGGRHDSATGAHSAHAGRLTLDRLRPGERATVVDVGDEDVRVQAIRLGLGEGADVRLATRIPAGPIVIRLGRQEIAVGRKLARRIVVDRAAEAAHVGHGRGAVRGRGAGPGRGAGRRGRHGLEAGEIEGTDESL